MLMTTTTKQQRMQTIIVPSQDFFAVTTKSKINNTKSLDAFAINVSIFTPVTVAAAAVAACRDRVVVGIIITRPISQHPAYS